VTADTPPRLTSLGRALAALAVLAVAIGIASVTIVLSSDHTSSRGFAAALILIAGWGFVGTGLYAWYRRPGNRTGVLLTAVGFTWFFQALESSDNAAIFAIGAIGINLPFAILIHLLVAFPSGRLEGRLQRTVVAGAYFVTVVLQWLWIPFVNPERQGCEGCPENPIRIDGQEGVADAVNAVQTAIAIPVVAATIAIIYLRWRRSSPSERRVLTPVIATGALAFALLFVLLVLDPAGASDGAQRAVFIAAVAAFACLPFALLAGLLRSRIGRDEELRSALTAENEQLTSELRAKVEELRASRARIVEAGYAERRRVERDLHDGAQQRLVALAMSLKLARSRLEADPQTSAELLDEAIAELGETTRELRELARGIHPAVLSDRGLEAALGALADRSPVPVEVVGTPPERLPAAVESAAYFVVAEALTNVARYAEAEAASVGLGREDGALAVEVADDGVGGADPTAGTGLRGLADRVAALGGELRVESPPGGGTKVRARIPLDG